MRRATLALLSLLAPGALAAQTVSASNGTQFNTTGLSAFSTFGDELGGLLVTATFAGGSTSSGSFGSLGGGQFGVDNGLFRLSIGTGDTFGADWTLTNLSTTTDPEGGSASASCWRRAWRFIAQTFRSRFPTIRHQ